MKAFVIFAFLLGIVMVHGSGVAVVPATAHAAVHAGVVPGSIVVGGAGPWGWGGLSGAWGPWGGHWGGHWGGWLGAGHDGQWLPDHSELLYDDGSYRPEHHWSHW